MGRITGGTSDEPFHPVVTPLMPPSSDVMTGSSEPSPIGTMVGGVMALVMAFVFAGMGAPGLFVLFALLTGVIFLVFGFMTRGRAIERIAEAERAAEESRVQFREEVAQSVKESMKGTIKVRCRYCGGLNDEHDDRCESCGAPL